MKDARRKENRHNILGKSTEGAGSLIENSLRGNPLGESDLSALMQVGRGGVMPIEKKVLKKSK